MQRKYLVNKSTFRVAEYVLAKHPELGTDSTWCSFLTVSKIWFLFDRVESLTELECDWHSSEYPSNQPFALLNCMKYGIDWIECEDMAEALEVLDADFQRRYRKECIYV